MVSQVEYKRKFLVVIDETEECDRALTFAAWRVKRTGGTVVLMTVIPKPEFIGLGVEDVLRAEAVEEAERNLDRRMARIKEIGEVRAESVIREGNGANRSSASSTRITTSPFWCWRPPNRPTAPALW